MQTSDNTLENWRSQIDDIDTSIVKLLAKRHEAIKHIGKLKSNEGIPLVDTRREATLLRRLADLAATEGLNPYLVVEVYQTILASSRQAQQANPAKH